MAGSHLCCVVQQPLVEGHTTQVGHRAKRLGHLQGSTHRATVFTVPQSISGWAGLASHMHTGCVATTPGQGILGRW